MLEPAWSYVLPVLALLSIALGAAAVLLCVAAGLRRMLRPHRAQDGPMHTGECQRRRCEACGRSWWAEEGVSVGLPRLWLARRVRRACRVLPWAAPQWTDRHGWSRCPICLSTRVRTSGADLLGPTDSLAWGLKLAGGAALLAGAGLLASAAAGLLAA